MRAILWMASLVTLAAQQQTPPGAAETTPAAAPAHTDPKPDGTQSAADASPKPTSEPWITGSIDLGYRWLANASGSFETYRSVVNLGSGPKLFGADFALLDSKHRFFDEAHVRAYTWFGEPYSTIHLDAKKTHVYDFDADYRNIAYFNNLPSYANPLLAQGIVLNEQSYDTRIRIAHVELDLHPNRWITPYVAYDPNTSSGTGVTVFVASRNEYPVPTIMNNFTNVFRAGVRLDRERFHAALEMGGTTFRSDQDLFWSGSENTGNVSRPVLGQTLFLSDLIAAYGISGNGIFSKVLLASNARSWLDLYGQFLYTQPESTAHFQQAAAGNFFLQSQLLFYNGQQNLISAEAKLPHTSASVDVEMRPLQRVRIIESWLTDRLHTSGSAASSQVVIGPGFSQQMSELLASSLATNYSRAGIDVLFDVTSRLAVRGGYRYVWGDGSTVTLPLAGLVGLERSTLRRNTGVGGVSYRPSQKISVSGEIEAAESGNVYFRTSLFNYQRVNARARYQVNPSLNLYADFNALHNHNPTPGINYDYLALAESFTVAWAPKSKTWDFQGTYTRSALQSNIFYLAPQDLQPQPSFYRDNAHTVTSLLRWKLPSVEGHKSEVTIGGSVFLSSGSRPSSYFQPLARLMIPLSKKLAYFTEWRYYGYGEAFYIYEGFRSNLITAGLRWTQ